MNLWKHNYTTQYFSYILYSVVKLIYSFDLHPNASIAKWMAGHHYGITKGQNVIVGANIVLLKGTTTGNKAIGPVVDQKPKPGNNVIIHVGVRILGGIEIGKNVVVGASSVVLNSIKPNCVAIENPARIKS